MIPIRKKSAPEVLLSKQAIAQKRGLNSKDAYDLLNHAEKEIILSQLMEEQGHLCAYCMRKIPDNRELPETIDRVTIEHWFPRNPQNGEERGQGLDYGNMLAVCSGNKGRKKTRKPRDLTCDAKRKGSHPQLTLNPCAPTTLDKISYKENGEMYSSDTNILDDINVKLNLNCTSDGVELPKMRKKSLEMLQAELPNDDVSQIIEFCRATLSVLESETDPKTEYSGILIWWLKDFLR